MQLLERETQLESLEAAWRGIEAGEGCVALVYGEAGIGKTSLVENFLAAQPESRRILRGACESLFTPRPLGPLHEIALQVGGTLLELVESAADRGAIFAASLAELGRQPTIVLVEDIHWADEATLDLLKYLGRRIQKAPALMILTYRDDGLGVDHPLRRVLGDLGASKATHRIPVAALTAEAVQELARDRGIDAAELHRITSGNPFFVTEVLAAGEGHAETVRDAVLARAAHLSPAARHVLEAAAILGLRVEPSLLSGLSGGDPASVEECFAAGMLQAEGDYYAFRHVLSREAILESTPMPRRIELHRMALRLLKSSPGPHIELARLAYHADGANDPAAVLEYAPAAARHASATSSHREAIALFELALRFAARLSERKHAELLDAHASELEYAGRAVDAAVALKRAIGLWHTLGDGLKEGRDLVFLAEIRYSSGQSRAGAEASRAAIALLESLPPSSELAEAYRAQTFIHLERRDAAGALEWGQKAFTLAGRFGNTETQARVSNYMGSAVMVNQYEKGAQLMEQSLRIGRENHLGFSVAGTLANWAQILVEIGRGADAESYLDEGIPYAAEHDDHYHLQQMLACKAQLRLNQGRWMEAEEIITDLLRAPNLDNPSYAYTHGLITLARLLARRGMDGAAERLEVALASLVQSDAIARIGTARAARAEVAWLAGDSQQAMQEAQAAYPIAVQNSHPWIAGELAFWVSRAGGRVELPGWAAEPFALQIAGKWRRAAQEWQKRGQPYEQGMALMDGDAAAQLEALQIFERLSAKPIIEKLKLELRAKGVRGIPRGPRPSTRENAFGLTARQLEVLACLVAGSTGPAIAAKLSLSPRTVDHHIASILQKTGTHSRAEAIALALRDNLLSS